MLRRATAGLAVTLLGAAGLVLPSAPASASACPDAGGVTVVVDYHELGGGLQEVCDSSGAGKVASRQFSESGFRLTRVQSEPGFVCRVNGLPSQDQEACVNTPPSDAYWGLWWSDGKSGSWSYASQGVDSLTVPEGGYVALSWNGSSTKSPPGTAATAHESSPSPTPTQHASPHGGGTHSGGSTPGPASGSASTGAQASPTPSTSPSDAASATPAGHGHNRHEESDHRGGHAGGQGEGRHHAVEPSDTASATGSASASASPVSSATSDPPSTGADGLPTWVGPAAIALLSAAGAAAAVVRRRRGASGP